MNVIAFVVLLVVFMGCQSSSTYRTTPQIQVTTIGSGSVPKQFGEGLVYEYEQAEVNPEALLTEMLNAGVPVVQAWLALDNTCMGPVGPRFTVELQQKDGRVPRFKFKEGAGRLECATTLKHYVISK